MDRLTRHLYKAMGIMKDETGYQASFDDFAGLQDKGGLEGHWTDPNVDIMAYHQDAVQSKAVPDTPQYWDRLRSKLTDHVQNKLDTGEDLSDFEYEVAARAGLESINDDARQADEWQKNTQIRLNNSNYEVGAGKKSARQWQDKWKDVGGIHTFKNLFGPSFGELYGG